MGDNSRKGKEGNDLLDNAEHQVEKDSALS